MIRGLSGLFFAALLILSVGWTTGCGPAVPEEELGEVVHYVPLVPGAEESYKLPDRVIDAKFEFEQAREGKEEMVPPTP